ncbi:hypothetical protein [Macrococcus capreoli]|uniref:hypothetical protein n=1 Tax=Macrococcus capreoli TaxID=2982690 RepID=UPI0021D5C909|nr:hypothetical protein [Macrococcus sp. TMW 2.2395]MCU7556592.1 hypothetical protein [Macrococcus sp. TMW 2.2395]
MKRLIIGLTTAAILLTGCGAQSKYKSEDAKLEVYTVNTAKAIRENLNEAGGVKAGEELNPYHADAKKFREAIPYIEAFKKDIKADKLSNDKRALYEDLLTALRPYDKFAELAKEDNDAAFAWEFKSLPKNEFLHVAEYYTDSYRDGEYKPLKDIRD